MREIPAAICEPMAAGTTVLGKGTHYHKLNTDPLLSVPPTHSAKAKAEKKKSNKELPLRSNPQSKDKAQDTAEEWTGQDRSHPGCARRGSGGREGKGGEGDSGDLGILTSAP